MGRAAVPPQVFTVLHDYRIRHGLRTPRESFFLNIRNFWAWADKFGGNFLRHLGYYISTILAL